MATASASEVKKSATSYSVEKGLASSIAASGADGRNVPFLDGLLALKTLAQLSEGDEGEDLFKGIIANETRMLKVAAKTLANNPALSEKLGNNLQAVMAMAQVLKQKRDDMVYDNILTSAISNATGDQFNLKAPDARLAEINGNAAAARIRLQRRSQVA